MIEALQSTGKGVAGLSNRVVAAGIFCIALFGRVGYWLIDGTTVNPSSGIWLSFCHFDIGKHMSYMFRNEGAELVMYVGYWVPLCIVQGVSGGLLDAMVAVQILLSALACVLIFDIGQRHVSLEAGAIAGLSLAVLFDGFVWTTRILGDSMLVFVLVLSIWALGKYINDPTVRNRYIVWVCLGYLSVTRPYGFPIVASWMAYDILPEKNDLRLNLFPYRRVASAILAIFVPVALVFLLRWGQGFMPDFWIRGAIVADDLSFPRYPFGLSQSEDFVTFTLVNIHHIIVMGVLKILVFFLPVVPRFSLAHNIINLITFVPIYTLGFIGAVHLYRKDRRLSTIWLTPVVVILGIIAVTFVDYSWGYRAPTGPIFALLAGYALTIHPWFSPLRQVAARVERVLPL